MFPRYVGPDKVSRHRHSCKSCFNAGVLDWQAKNPRAKHISYLKRTYNLSFEEYQDLMKSGCEVCGSYENLRIDHNHDCCPSKTKTCGKCIRGVLCDRHNLAEGLLRGNPEEAMALAQYMLKNRGELS